MEKTHPSKVTIQQVTSSVPFWSRVRLLPLSLFFLIMGIAWRNVDVFILGLGDTWLNILPCKLFPLLIIVSLFWLYRRTEIESVLGVSSADIRNHLVIGATFGVSLYFLGDVLATIIYWVLFDSTFALELIIVDVGLLWYSAFFFLINAIYEEILFRGLLQNGLKEYITINQAILVSAAIFGIYHIIWPLFHASTGELTISHLFVITVFSGLLGGVFGIYYAKFSQGKTLLGPITAHWLLNFLNENFKISFDRIISGPDVLLVSPIQMLIALVLVSFAFALFIVISWRCRIDSINSWLSSLKAETI